MIVFKKTIKKIKGLVIMIARRVLTMKICPLSLFTLLDNIIILGVQFDIVVSQVLVKIICPKDLCNLHQLIRITVSTEEWLYSIDHGGKHCPKRPHVKRIVVLLKVDEKLWTFEVS